MRTDSSLGRCRTVDEDGLRGFLALVAATGTLSFFAPVIILGALWEGYPIRDTQSELGAVDSPYRTL